MGYPGICNTTKIISTNWGVGEIVVLEENDNAIHSRTIPKLLYSKIGMCFLMCASYSFFGYAI